MNIFRMIFLSLALSMLGIAWAGPIPETQVSTIGLSSFDLPAEQTGSFEVSFDATPLADKIDVFTGLSAKDPWRPADVAVIVRFNNIGTIDARGGDTFRADTKLEYSANKVYRVRMVVNVASRTYSVFVTPPGQPEVPLAKNFAFRSDQSSVKVLGKIVLAGFKGTTGMHRISGLTVSSASSNR